MDEHSQERMNLARVVILLAKNQHAKALQDLVQLHPDPPLDVATWLLQARLLERAEVEKCWSALSSALQHYPHHPVVNLRAGVFMFERGDVERARSFFEISWANGPIPETGVHLGRIYAQCGDLARACEFLIQAACFENEPGYWGKLAEDELTHIVPKS